MSADHILQSTINFCNEIDLSLYGSHTAADMAEYWIDAEKDASSAVERKSDSMKVAWNNVELLRFSAITFLLQKLQLISQQVFPNGAVELRYGKSAAKGDLK